MNIRTVLLAIAVLGLPAYCVSAKGILTLHGGNSAGCCAENPACPQCHCEVTTEEGKVKKHCYEVECEQICIPRVRIPWHLLGQAFSNRSKCDTCNTGDCSQKPCGEVRTIRVLKKKEYECKVCKYKWTPVCNVGCCDTECSDADEGGDAAVSPPVPTATAASYQGGQKPSRPASGRTSLSDYFQASETY